MSGEVKLAACPDLVRSVAIALCKVYDKQEREDGRRGGALVAYNAGSFAVEFWDNMACAAIEATRPPVVTGQDGMTRANRDCLAKAKPGEPMFIVLGRDPDGGNIVRLWAQRRKEAGGDPAHYGPVFAIADEMDAWRAAGNLPESAPDAGRYQPVTGQDGEGGWQPIESAPKDTDVLVCGEGFVTVGHFDCDCWSDRLNEDEPIFPTHWMQLPKAQESPNDCG